MSQYIPGAESPENLQLAKQAKDEFVKVLETESQRHHRPGVAGLA